MSAVAEPVEQTEVMRRVVAEVERLGSIKAVAMSWGVTYQYVYKLLNGLRQPGLVICDRLGLPRPTTRRGGKPDRGGGEGQVVVRRPRRARAPLTAEAKAEADAKILEKLLAVPDAPKTFGLTPSVEEQAAQRERAAVIRREYLSQGGIPVEEVPPDVREILWHAPEIPKVEEPTDWRRVVRRCFRAERRRRKWAAELRARIAAAERAEIERSGADDGVVAVA